MSKIFQEANTQTIANAFFICLCGLIFVVGSNILDREMSGLLRSQAEVRATEWAQHLIDGDERLAALISTPGNAEAARNLLPRTDPTRKILNYRIYDLDGQLRTWTGADLDRALKGTAAATAAPQAAAAAAATNIYRISTPLLADGRKFATMVADVDLTDVHAFYSQTGRRLGLLAAGALVLIVSVAGLVRLNARREANQRLRFLVNNDHITRLPNRASFLRTLSNVLTDAAVAENAVSLYVLDIDRFSRINQALGSDGGDTVLRAVANRLREICAGRAFCARLDGDGFGIVHTTGNDREGGRDVGDRILAIFERPIEINGAPVVIAASIGKVTCDETGIDEHELIKRAELACRVAKTSGGQQLVEYDSHTVRDQERAQTIGAVVEDACANNRFELNYQPVIDLQTGRIRSFEALIRLRDRDGNSLSPADFIPIAERLGLIHDIGRWTLLEACRTASGLPSHLGMAVNLSPVQFASGTLTDDVRTVIEATRIDPSRLELEITEGVLLGDSESVIGQLEDLRALGIRIALDDFGTGYSSMNYLWQFPFHKLKIDQSFIKAMDKHPKARALLAKIVDLGRTLNLVITAEGIETEEHAACVRDLGCDLAQGYLFGRPVPQTALAAVVITEFAESIGLAKPGTGETARKVSAAS